MARVRERGKNGVSPARAPLKTTIGSAHLKPNANKSRPSGLHKNGNVEAETNHQDIPASSSSSMVESRVGVLPLVEGALDVGDDGRAVVWLDIDNTLYGKGTEISKFMTERIRKYIIGLGLGEEEAERLHQKYYKEYGLAIRGLVMHHKIDALDYDSKCDATLPLEKVLKPNEEHKAMLRDLDRTKCRVWALTNAYKTHAVRVLKLLELYDFIEGVIYCDYAQEKFACKPEKEFYDAALDVVGLKDTSRCYFVDDSQLNIRAAGKLGWGHCVLFSEDKVEASESNNQITGDASTFDASVFIPKQVESSIEGAFDREKIQNEFRKLTQRQRVELLHIVLQACLPGDIISMTKTLEKQLRLTSDLFSNLPDDVTLRIFEKLEVKELLNCQRVSKRWRVIAANPLLWKSHALGLTEGDPVGLIAPSDPNGWETLVRGLYFRESNWSQGICQNVTMMQGHTGFVTAMKLKGRKTLVTGSYDETIRVWDLYTGACKKVLKAKAIACLDFLYDEGILAAGLYDTGRVMVWDMKTWSLLETLSGHNRGIRNVAISHDYLVSVGQDKTIVVWDWRNGTKVARFGQQSNVSLGVSIVDRDKIVAVTVDGIIRTFCIGKKEMIGQYDLSKLSPSLGTQLSGLKGGTLMMQWFAAHRNTITVASHNLVVHLKWQEHVVPIRHSDTDAELTSTPTRLRSRIRSDSTTSNTSTTSNVTNRSSDPLRRTTSNATTPVKTRAGIQSGISSSFSSSNGLNRLMTPSRFQSPSNGSPRASPSPASPSPWPRSSTGGQSASSQSSPSRAPLSPASNKIDTVQAASLPNSTPSSPLPTTSAQTRIAPNLSTAPIVVDVLQTPDAAAGCVDPAKKRIVLATRFSSRAGADRRIYTSTLDDKCTSRQGDQKMLSTENDRDVVPVGGAWQEKKQDLATPARNPMSLVLDHESCVVGTSEGLVYRMGFVGSKYNKGWIEDDNIEEEIEKPLANEDGSTTITDLLQLRTVWSHLFV